MLAAEVGDVDMDRNLAAGGSATVNPGSAPEANLGGIRREF